MQITQHVSMYEHASRRQNFPMDSSCEIHNSQLSQENTIYVVTVWSLAL